MFDQPVSRRAKIIGAIALVALVIGFVVAIYLVGPGRGTRGPANIEAAFERGPGAEASRALKANFPDDYQRLLRRASEVTREQGRGAAEREVSLFMERFIHSKANAIMAAPDRELQRIGGGQVTLMHALRDGNVSLCAQYAISGLAPGTRMPPGAVGPLTRLSVYIIEAARAGERPGRTPRPTLSAADQEAWFSAIREIDPTAARHLENDTVRGQPPDAQCRAGIAVYEAVTRLPGPRAANVTAFLVRESMNTSAVR
jgi:hypothetical protein